MSPKFGIICACKSSDSVFAFNAHIFYRTFSSTMMWYRTAHRNFKNPRRKCVQTLRQLVESVQHFKTRFLQKRIFPNITGVFFTKSSLQRAVSTTALVNILPTIQRNTNKNDMHICIVGAKNIKPKGLL